MSLFANAKEARRLSSIMNSCRKDSSDAVLDQSETAIVSVERVVEIGSHSRKGERQPDGELATEDR